MGSRRISVRARRRGRRNRNGSENLTGYLFVFPSVLLITVFGIFPVFFTVYVSLHKWRIKRGRFIGLANYGEMFGSPLYLLLVIFALVGIAVAMYLLGKARANRGALPTGSGVFLLLICVAAVAVLLPYLAEAGDDEMFASLRVTIWYSLGTVPVQLALGLLLASFLYQKIPAKQAFRVIYLLPYIVPSVASAAVFERLFSLKPESFANQVLALFGRPPAQWLLEPKGIFFLLSGERMAAVSQSIIANYWLSWAHGPSLALVSIMFFNWWVFVGYNALIYTNGLANIPRQLYEAAEVDGAGRLAVFFKITLPMLSPSTYFLTLLGIIGTFKAFAHIYVLRHPAARGEVDPMSVQIFFTFFRKSRFGYAAAISLLLFAIVLILTLVQRRIMKERVHYG
ncbi:MAG: sugar ABC transporter permease [Spirochaetaceae bacterium]|nr:MAG: sugar ABC transporter permease [Spirochaetaceae bacterium]